jgi:hypothetical protein
VSAEAARQFPIHLPTTLPAPLLVGLQTHK